MGNLDADQIALLVTLWRHHFNEPRFAAAEVVKEDIVRDCQALCGDGELLLERFRKWRLQLATRKPRWQDFVAYLQGRAGQQGSRRAGPPAPTPEERRAQWEGDMRGDPEARRVWAKQRAGFEAMKAGGLGARATAAGVAEQLADIERRLGIAEAVEDVPEDEIPF